MRVAEEVREVLTWLEKASTRRDWPTSNGSASPRPGRSACRWPTCRFWPSVSAAITNWPLRSGRPAATRLECWPRSSRNRRWSRQRRWIAGVATSTTGASATPSASACSIARRTRFGKVKAWATRRDEFVRRAAFALLAGLALHDKEAGDEAFVRCLPLIEAASSDERNFVKKAVNWALRAIGRRNVNLHAEALAVARRLSAAADAAPRWIGKGALRELTSPVVMRKLAALTAKRASPLSSPDRRPGSRS